LGVLKRAARFERRGGKEKRVKGVQSKNGKGRRAREWKGGAFLRGLFRYLERQREGKYRGAPEKVFRGCRQEMFWGVTEQ